MTICDCQECTCWMPVFIDGETVCYSCTLGIHQPKEKDDE